VIKFITRLLFTFFLLILSATATLSQTDNLYVIDSFGDHTLPGWYWGGTINMKYSHSQDNLENGYGIISASNVTPNTFIGLIRREQKFQVSEDNILSLMLQGVSNDVVINVQILYDMNYDTKYDESNDTRLEAKPFSLNFSGWKEIHFNINRNEFKVVSKNKDEDFSVLENEAMGIQIYYTAGKDYKAGPLETGVAMISERYSKDVKKDNAESDASSEESYFQTKNYPNPFNPETKITYTLKQATIVKITVYDRLGREVTELVNESQSEGEHEVSFNASNLPSGVYFYRIKTPEKVEVRKMVFAK